MPLLYMIYENMNTYNFPGPPQVICLLRCPPFWAWQ